MHFTGKGIITTHKYPGWKKDRSYRERVSVLSRTEKGHGIFFFKKGTLHVEFTKKGT
jgi:hypothetical protein